MRLLDLFCCQGGAAMGYYRAGFDVVGVDIEPQPRYPFEFHQADALEYLAEHGHEFDAIHASPPCQRYSSATLDPDKHPDLYQLTVDALQGLGKPYIVENVIGAPYNHGVILCGSMFGLSQDGEWIQRHRNFETSFFMWQPQCNHPDKRAVTVTGKSFITETREYKHGRQTTFILAKKMMGIDWADRHGLAEAIPPAYTEYIGQRLMETLTKN